MTGMGRITAALLATASTATLTLALAPAAEAAPHQVKYVISSDRDFLSQTLVLQNEPPSKSAYDTESSKYLVRNSTRIAPDAPFVVETTLNDPTQWAYVSASAAARPSPAPRLPLRGVRGRCAGHAGGWRNCRHLLTAAVVTR